MTEARDVTPDEARALVDDNILAIPHAARTTIRNLAAQVERLRDERNHRRERHELAEAARDTWMNRVTTLTAERDALLAAIKLRIEAGHNDWCGASILQDGECSCGHAALYRLSQMG